MNKKGKVKYYVVIALSLVLQFVFPLLVDKPEWVERYYSTGIYPLLSYLSIVLFSWLPFSVGDLLYVLIVVVFGVLLLRCIRYFLKKEWGRGSYFVLKSLAFVSILYLFFYINWGFNYYRQPLARQMHLALDETHERDYINVLGKYIVMANLLREEIDLTHLSRAGVEMDLESYIRKDTVFDAVLSKTQVKIKRPWNSALISQFSVSGYFNPFTLEAHVNQEIPNSLYPFVQVHELAHQMGVGFEDECNFIAFRLLVDHKNSWYRYAAYYAAIQSLLKPLRGDREQMERISGMLSDKVRADFQEEYAFWLAKQGWLDKVSSYFYNFYLKHNNQPEGLARYGMMAKLVVAWEIQQRHELSKGEKEKLRAPSLQ